MGKDNVIIIKSDGTIEKKENDFTKIGESMEEIYNLIGNNCKCFQHIPATLLNYDFLPSKEGDIIEYAMIIDDNGKIKELPYNELATAIYNNPYDFVVGNVVLCGIKYVEDYEMNFCGLPNEVTDFFLHISLKNTK